MISLEDHKQARLRERRSHYIGFIRNGLKVVEYSHSGGHRETYWKIKCVCGNIFITRMGNLLKGKTKSCGCLKKKLVSIAARKPNHASIFNEAFRNHSASAKRRGYEIYISKEEYCEIIKKACHFCGGFSIRRNMQTHEIINSNSVDRLNNEPYYKKENCVPACFRCQHIKRDMTEKQFLEHVNKIYLFRELKNV